MMVVEHKVNNSFDYTPADSDFSEQAHMDTKEMHQEFKYSSVRKTSHDKRQQKLLDEVLTYP